MEKGNYMLYQVIKLVEAENTAEAMQLLAEEVDQKLDLNSVFKITPYAKALYEITTEDIWGIMVDNMEIFEAEAEKLLADNQLLRILENRIIGCVDYGQIQEDLTEFIENYRKLS